MAHVIGHRGAPRVEPENTVASLRAALALGADGVELDVRRTADGVLAVHHDAHLADGRAIVATTWDDMPDHVPDLAAALDAVQGAGVVNVEIKNWPDDVDFDAGLGIVDRVLEALAARPAAERARVLVSCFHLATVDRVRALAPDLATAWLVLGPVEPLGDTTTDPVAALVAQAAGAGHDALHPHHAFVTPTLVEAAHAAGLAVNTWTCDDPERIRWLDGIGVDGVVTNVPDVALAALGRVPSADPA